MNSEQRLRLAVEAIGLGFWEWDLSTNTAHWDERMFAIFGLPPAPDGLVDYTAWSRAVAPSDLADQEAILRQLITGHNQGAREYRIRRYSDGEERVIQSVQAVHFDEEGIADWVVGTDIDITERRNMETALREEEQKFKMIARHSPIGMALVAPNGQWLEVNPALCAIVGYSEAELLARDFQSITHPDDLQNDLDFVQQMLRGEIKSYTMEKRYLHRQGHVVWILLSVSLVRDASGEAEFFISQIQDISERKMLEAERQMIITVAGLGIFRCDTAEQMVRRVDTYQSQIGPQTGRVFAERRLSQYIHPDDLPGFLSATRACEERDEKLAMELRVRDHHDAFTWVRMRAERLDARGRELLCVYSDIAQLKATEGRLADALKQTQALLNALPDTVLTYDTSGCLMEYYDPHSGESPVGLLYTKVLAPEICQTLDQATAAAFEHDGPQRLHCRRVDDDGQVQHFHVTVTQVADGGAFPSKFLAVIRDETDYHNALESAQHAAHHDTLTGLPNRRLLNDRLAQARFRSRRDANFGALFMIDLDKFKALNDTHGHDAGDRFLQEVAIRLRSAVRAQDTVARLGGDEFAVLLEGLDEAGAAAAVAAVIAKIHAAFSAPCDLGKVSYPMLASIGHALFRDTTPGNDEIFIEADRLMYADKCARRAAG